MCLSAVGFRLLVLCVVFTSFSIGIYHARGDWATMGGVFWRTILITTLIGIVLSFVYAPLTWCSFCPIGTLAAWAAPRKAPLPKSFVSVHIDHRCTRYKKCARVCPMQLAPYDSRGKKEGFMHPDSFKCGKCTLGCTSSVLLSANLKQPCHR